MLLDDLREGVVCVLHPSGVVRVHAERDRGWQRHAVAGGLDEAVEPGREVGQVGEGVRDVEAVAAVGRGEFALIGIEDVAGEPGRGGVGHQQRVALVDAGRGWRRERAAQRGAGHFDGDGVDVDPVHEVLGDAGLGGGICAGQEARDRGDDPPRGVEEERARAASRIEHSDARRRRAG